MQPLPAAKASQPERTAHPPSRQVCQFARRAVSVEPAPAPPRAWTARVEPNEPGRHLAESLATLAPAVHGSATPTCQAHGEDRALICSRGHEHATVPVHTQKQPSGRCLGGYWRYVRRRSLPVTMTKSVPLPAHMSCGELCLEAPGEPKN